ncbi:MAG TPA: alkaline phosphatase family protein, partial [Actinomycetota bacterium]|nr:alkaline phosphatase family protein [Actinomycetota bacterium]
MPKGTLCLLAAILIAACTPDAAEPPPEAPTRESGETAQGDCSALRPLINRVRRGWYPGRSPQLGFVVREPNFVGAASSPPHDGPWDFLVDVPLVLYGPGVIRSSGTVDRPASIVDLAPTTAALIGFDDWPKRSGRVLEEAIEPGSSPPRMVVTAVWDGVGDNTLRAHPRVWPFLSRLMQDGTSYSEMTVGSTPSNTAPIHTSLGTGAFPKDHGIISVRQLDGSGNWVDSWEDEDPAALELATIADLYDRARDNTPLIGAVGTANWHLGMIGHGAALAGADLDLAALLTSSGGTHGNSAFYEVPSIAGGADLQELAEALDLADGRADGRWRGNSLDDLALLESSPAFALWQQEVVEDLIVERDFGADAIT